MAKVPWDAAQKETFLRSQFALQAHHYRKHYPDTAFQVILGRGEPIGRLYVHRSADSLHILDIALIPECRNRGLGTALFQELIAEANREGKKIVLYVEEYNPARHLYERLGFRAVGEDGVYQSMEYAPG